MAELPAADLRAALDFVGEAAGFEDIDSFRSGILPGLRRLVPSDLVGYNEVEPGGGPALVLTYPEPLETGEALAKLAYQHPLISVQMNGDHRAYKISDFLSVRQFHRLDLYGELYEGIGAEDQIAFGLPGPMVIGVAMNRDRRSFSERERDLLDLLAPHLARARARIVERERGLALVAGLEAGLGAGGGAVVIVGADGRIDAGPGALALLRRYFPAAPAAALPLELAEWLGGAGDPRPLRVSSPRGSLDVRELALGDPARRLLLLEERRPLSAERLRALGLTPRQAEVLALLAGGAGVPEIAAELYLSPATVRKHLEHVYSRLRVHSRAEAIAAACTHESAIDPA